MSRHDQIEVPVAGNVMLVVGTGTGEDHTIASLYDGLWPEGAKLSCTVSPANQVYVDIDAKGIWFHETFVPLTMTHLLAVADFLHVDIPLPVLPAAAGATPAHPPASAAAGSFVHIGGAA